MKACCIDGCPKPVVALSMCGAHYRKQYRAERRVSCPGHRQHLWLATGVCKRCGAKRVHPLRKVL
jgi:hypothetical protein